MNKHLDELFEIKKKQAMDIQLQKRKTVVDIDDTSASLTNTNEVSNKNLKKDNKVSYDIMNIYNKINKLELERQKNKNTSDKY